jgi:inositol-phosphate phosphatase/L-galactose 1-phosphate phosphatase/histidinol-phosphatase
VSLPVADVPVELIALAHRLADASGAVIRPYFRAACPVETKADATPVTLADKNAERAIRDILAVLRPDDGVWGEEMGQERLDAEWVWVIDPIDGTKAFVAGKPLFATLIGLLHWGKPVLGVIDQPILRERWVGGVGHVACLNDAPVRTSACTMLAQARLNTTSPLMFTDDAALPYQQLQQATRQITYGGDAYGYALLASGHLDLVLETQLKFHDFAALIPIITAAGGVVTDWSGQTLSAESAGDVLASANPVLHQQALEKIRLR